MYNDIEKSAHPAWLQDYHLHTAVTIDGRMDEVEVCERALQLGLNEIAFTNHVMLNQPDYRMSVASLSQHWDKLQDCQRRYPDIQICLGLEMDYYPSREAEIKETIEFYEQTICRPFDIILGSIHEIKGNFFSNKRAAEAFFPGRDLLTTYGEYFNLATQAAESQLFDIMAHPDLIKKYTGQLTPRISFDEYISSAETFISALIKNNVGIEINTKGLKLSVNEAYPSQQFLELYLDKARASGVNPVITIGSDAHKVVEVGFKIVESVDRLKKLDVHSITSFIHRKQVYRMI